MDVALQMEKFGPDAANGGIQHEVGAFGDNYWYMYYVPKR